MWVGHVDTVPLIDEEDQRMHVEGDILHGLGSADMKSGCAAIVEAGLTGGWQDQDIADGQLWIEEQRRKRKVHQQW